MDIQEANGSLSSQELLHPTLDFIVYYSNIIFAANILFAFIAIERFPHDGLDRRHFSIRQLGKLALATLAT